jgi:hypothetical protein
MSHTLFRGVAWSIVLTFVCCALKIAGASGGDVDSGSRGAPQELLRLQTADPARDAERALTNGDRRFLAVAGYVVEIPGVPDSRLDGFHVWLQGTRTIEGTTDAGMFVDLQAGAKRYAAAYNETVLGHVKARWPGRWLEWLFR